MHYSFANYESNDSKNPNHSFQKVNINYYHLTLNLLIFSFK